MASEQHARIHPNNDHHIRHASEHPRNRSAGTELEMCVRLAPQWDSHPTKQSQVPSRHRPLLLHTPSPAGPGQIALAGGQSSGHASSVPLKSASPICIHSPISEQTILHRCQRNIPSQASLIRTWPWTSAASEQKASIRLPSVCKGSYLPKDK